MDMLRTDGANVAETKTRNSCGNSWFVPGIEDNVKLYEPFGKSEEKSRSSAWFPKAV